jgi:membrane fusion protein, multidrug efflux system
MIKRFVIASILLVLICGGLIGFNVFRDRAIQQFFANMPVQPLSVSTTVVKPISWTPDIQAIGTARAARGVDLTVETTGIVKEILFRANQRVEEGAVLVQLDDAQQQADLAAAKAQAALDVANLNRAIQLQRREVGTNVNVESARAAADASAAQVEKLQALLDQKQVKAPFDGTVGIPKIDLGQYLSPGTTVATLQDLDTMRVDFSVPEQRLGQLKIEQKVRLGFSEDDMRFTGSIYGIEPKVDPVTRLVAVRAEVANPEGKISPGQFVQVRVELQEENNILALPQTALVTSLYGDYVYVVRPAKADNKPTPDENAAPSAAASGNKTAKVRPGEASAAAAENEAAQQQGADSAQPDTPSLTVAQVFVKAGRRNAGMVEIVDGVKAGDQVVTAGQNRLNNGAPVIVDNTIDPTKPYNARTAQ